MTWQEAIRTAFELADENGWRYRVWRNPFGDWSVTRAGRRKRRS